MLFAAFEISKVSNIFSTVVLQRGFSVKSTAECTDSATFQATIEQYSFAGMLSFLIVRFELYPFSTPIDLSNENRRFAVAILPSCKITPVGYHGFCTRSGRRGAMGNWSVAREVQ